MNFVISDACTGCGLCARICSPAKIHMKDGRPVIDDDCMMCGHCYAVCPFDAISYDSSREECFALKAPAKGLSEFVKAEDLLTAFWSRRSIRYFSNEPVSDEEVNYLIEAAHSSPTASNAQNVRYIILQEKKKDYTIEMMKALGEMGDELLRQGGLDPLMENYAKRWSGMLMKYLSDGVDGLFFNAPLVVLFVGPHAVNASISAQQMSLMAEALGLGSCYIGFAKRAISYDPRLAAKLGIGDDEELVCAMAIGRPRVRFERIPARKPAQITRL